MKILFFSIVLFAQMMCLSEPAMAALRGSAGSFVGGAGGSSISTTYSGSPVQVGDLIIIVTGVNLASAQSSVTWTDPSGFTPGSSLASPLADHGWGGNYDWVHVSAKIATAADAGTPTYTVSENIAASLLTQQVIVEAGVFSSVNAALPNNLFTAVQAQTGGPITYALTSASGVAPGSDVIAVDVLGGNGFTGTTTASCSGYSDVLTTYDSTTAYSPIVSSFVATNVGGGTAPSASIVITTAADGAATAIGFMAVVAPANSGAQKGGMFFADGFRPKIPAVAAAMFMPLAWSIGRRNKLARRRWTEVE